jgi:hypothetical protein
MVASRASEDAAFPDLQYAMEPMGMTEEHMASLPPPPPLSAYTSPKSWYKGQMVPSLDAPLLRR